MNKNKTATLIALFLMFAMAISLLASPSAYAQTNTRQTYPFIGATPNPVGVGQEVLLHVGITHPLSVSFEGWEGLSVTIEKPDGTKTTISGIRTDSTGGTGTTFTPTEPGNYTLQTHFPEQVIPSLVTRVTPPTPAGTTMLASSSAPLTLVVLEDPITYYPGHALPTEYWTRPIDSQLREWTVIAANWLDATRRNPKYVAGNDDAPETAHILWAKTMTQGGLVGDPLGEHSFEMGDAYEGKFVGSIILGGRLYYNKYAGPSSGNVDIYREYVCVDLRTGEELWSKVFLNHMTLARGQIMYWDTYDYHGSYDYLWFTQGSTWVAFDAFTGDWVYNMTNMPSGTLTYGPKGEFLIYTLNLAGGYMTIWNSSNVASLYSNQHFGSHGWGMWRPYGKTVDAVGPIDVTIGGDGLATVGPDPYQPATMPTGLAGYQLNVSIPTDLAGSVRGVFPLDKAIGSSFSNTEVTSWGINLEPGSEGQVLYKKTVAAPTAWTTGNVSIQFQTSSADIYLYWAQEIMKFYAFSAETGNFLWGVADSQNYLNYYGVTSERPAVIAYDKIFSSGTSGIVYCYDIETGDLLWTYDAVDQYSEILWANNWWLFPLFATDGKIYYGHTEHSPINPMPRGAPFICLNATTGKLIWRSDGLFRQTLWGGLGIIGDSVIATMDTYDNRIYAIGKGPSATTVTAGPEVTVHGNNVVVKGMVTDISPGTDDFALQKRFPSGVPAVSDANMSDWMLHVYKQFARPADIVGVEVVISVLDPNNNCYEVARTTSDESGYFGCTFEPEVPGFYRIIATFEGSGAYYGSYAETFVNVEEAPVVVEPTPSPAPMTDTYVMGFGIGMIIAIVVVGLLLFLLLRKR